ncbi:hypothetical protein ACFQ3N_19700 [Virgibacillus byunsanensis]|uniref:ABC transporter ATP-binding protein n=1 Tax=Virgibacillus byunsanensis TaxID=570945 RepID=A0ABW3LQ79_9BACI
MKNLIEKTEATIVMIIHDMEIVSQYASRVVVINAGRVVIEGSPNEMIFS